MLKKITLVGFAVFILCVPTLFSADFSLGLKVSNNRWQKTWLFTPAPEFTISYRLLALQVDGTLGTYETVKSVNTFSIQSRFSMIPMIQLTPGPLVFRLGYGLSYKYLRNESQIASDQYQFFSTKKWEGEFRCSGGISVPVYKNIKINLMGGYDFIDEDNYAFFATGGLSFIAGFQPAAPQQKTTFMQPKTLKESKQQSSQLKLATPIKTISIIKQQDPVFMELNTTIESAFMSNGIEVINWDKLKMDVQNALKQDTSLIKPDDDFESLRTNDIQLAAFASKIMPIDAIVQTQLYYDYETYGKDIFVQSASIKLIQPQTGQLLTIIQYDGNRTPFAAFKKKVTEDITRLLE